MIEPSITPNINNEFPIATRFIKWRIPLRLKKNICFSTMIFFVICIIIYLEILSYSINTYKWFDLKCTNRSNCLKILLVADPQITGHEQVEILNPLAQYDCDSYLKKTYQHVTNFVNPDLTIYLGDLMDEGSTATDLQYAEYLKRFLKIFPIQEGKQIWIPGDNDIGGEGSDRVTSYKVQRFKNAFPQKDILQFGKYVFAKVNPLIQNIPEYKQKRDFYDTSQIFIVLSHIPLMFMPSLFVDRVFSNLQPQLSFVAHQHKAMIISTEAFGQDRHIIPLTVEENQVHKLILGANEVYEIMVPTCSYRMGTDKIGFGYAVLENDELQYTMLWSPSRYHQLGSYVLMFIFVIIFYLLVKCCL